MTKTTDFSAEIAVINEAFAAAQAACAAHIAANPNVWWPCGFAWVKIKPARGRLVAAMKHMGIGYTDDVEGGYSIWNPAGGSTQWMDAKQVGCDAFVAVLKKHYPALRVQTHTRMD